MVSTTSSKYRPFALAAAVAITVLLPAVAFATDPTPDPAEPAVRATNALHALTGLAGGAQSG